MSPDYNFDLDLYFWIETHKLDAKFGKCPKDTKGRLAWEKRCEDHIRARGTGTLQQSAASKEHP